MYTYTNPGGIRQQGHTLLYIIYRVTCTDINRHIYNNNTPSIFMLRQHRN
ncbi:Uncharacterised protein [Prevotella nigrescens]|nr:Uncharacterised protein [Prevotella nigrescens]